MPGISLASGGSGATRLKDLVSIEGVRDNQLVGYGLVVGLAGTGDSQQTIFSAQSLTNLLARMGVQVSPTAIMVRNTAAVLVTADLPPFAQPGTRIDITVGAIGDSRNLQGGMLVMTPLKGADGQIYAAAQGSVVTGGFAAGGRGNSKVLNHPTAGRVPRWRHRGEIASFGGSPTAHKAATPARGFHHGRPHRRRLEPEIRRFEHATGARRKMPHWWWSIFRRRTSPR